MIKENQLSWDSRRERLRYGFGAVCIGIAALLFLLSFQGGAAQGLAAPAAPAVPEVPIMSSVTSISTTDNTLGQAVAGELVTVTAIYNVPAGDVIYNASPRVVLEDGLYPTGASYTYTLYTGTRTNLRGIEGTGNIVAYNGALLVFENLPPITGSDTFTVTVYAVRRQQNYVGAPSDISHNEALRVQGILRYCTSDPECVPTDVVNTPANATAGQVIAIRPEIGVEYTETYLDVDGLGVGGGQVRLDFGGYPADRATAYNVVFTATLGAGLTDITSNDGVSSPGPDGTTYVVWTMPSLPAGVAWQPVVTASLPAPTFVIGYEAPCRGTATYETFAEPVPYEGKYSATVIRPLRPGLSVVTKTSIPDGGAVTMGDRVTYTVVFQQAPGTLFQAPQVVDTQPLGFHYISGTLALENATLTSIVTEAGGTGSAYQNLKWMMADLEPAVQLRVITATYAALNTGLNYNGVAVHNTAANMKANRATISANVTGAVLSWTPPVDSTYVQAARANAGALGVIQPYMGDSFSTQRFDSGPKEVNGEFTFITRFRNNGFSSPAIPAIPAQELQVCDTLLPGLAFQVNDGCFVTGTSTECLFSFTPPALGAEGEVCWAVPALPKSTLAYEFRYRVKITDAAYPGVYTNAASIKTYASRPDGVEGRRIYTYELFPHAAPKADCGPACYTILGLAASKTPGVDSVAPGELITYVLAYVNTSAENNYTGLVIVDTYDTLLTFESATPPPVDHDETARQLTWNPGSLPIGDNGQIVLTMRVSSVIEDRYRLTNTMTLDSDQTALRDWVVGTDIDVASLHVSISGPETTYAGGAVIYTVAYSNTGSQNNAPVTLTLDYGPYLTYVNASPLAPVPGTQNRVFVDTVPNNGVNKTLTINLSTNAPLPYTLEEIVSTVQLASPGAPSQADAWTTTLQRPVFQFHKMGPPAAAGQSGTMQYTFELINTGDYTATNLVITDTWDTATSFETSPGWTLAGSGTYANYTISSLAPSETATVNPLTIKVNALQDSYLNQADLSSDQTTSQHTELLIWAHSIALAKTAYPDPAFPGRVLTYTLYYTNTGIGIVNAVITDTLDPGFNFLGQSFAQAPGCQAPGWIFNYTDHKAVWTCASLLNGATGHFIITGEVTADENTHLVNEAISKGNDQPLRPMDEPLHTLVARPWLSVNKVGAPTHPVAPGDHVTYTLTYENYGSYTAYNVIVKDQLPTQLTYTGCDPACTHTAGLVSWTIGELPVDATGEVTVYATVNAGTGGQTAVNSNYTIENTTIWQRLLPTQTEQGDPVNTTILNPQLTLTKVAAPTVVQVVNETIVYTITYANTGGGLLHNVVITDVLDAYTGFTSASTGCSHTGELTGGTVTCHLGDLLNSENRDVVIHVRVSSGLNAGDTILNQAQGRTDEAPLTSSNTTRVWYQIAGEPEIAWAPSNFTPSADEGSTTILQNTLTVSNLGADTLFWSIEVMPTTATWLKVSVSGPPGTDNLPGLSTAPDGNTLVTVYFNPTGLAVGVHNASLRIVSNDPDEGVVLVPVTFTIRALGEDYYIYLPLVLKNH